MSTLLLDHTWPLIDTKGQGFIYAKDFPLLLSKMQEVLNRGKPTHKQVSLISKTGHEITRKFANDQEFFKVYKDDFKVLFDGLIGMSFKAAVDSCTDDGTLEKLRGTLSWQSAGHVDESLISGETILERQKPLPDQSNKENRRDITGEAVPPDAKEPAANPGKPRDSLLGSPASIRRVRNLQVDVESLKEEVLFRDEIIREKDRELLDLTKKVSDYKDKYEFLEREFQFYKDHAETKAVGNSPDTTKHDFIIAELRRKIEEQTGMISQMKAQMPSESDAPFRGAMESTQTKIVPLHVILKALALCIVFLLSSYLVISVVRLMADSAGELSSVATRGVHLEWWEKSSLLSKMRWFFTDAFDELGGNALYNEGMNDNYDKVFGIRSGNK